MPHFIKLCILLWALCSMSKGIQLYGCSFEPTVCESEEVCSPDGLFGHCEGEQESQVEYDLNPDELDLLRLELVRLVKWGYNWHSARTQCTVSYMLMTRKHNLPYDPQFCNVREPAAVLQLVQLFDRGYEEIDVASDITGKSPTQLIAESQQAREEDEYPEMDIDQILEQQEPETNTSLDDVAEVVRELMESKPRQARGRIYENDDQYEPPPPYNMEEDEETFLNDALGDIMKGRKVDLSGLSPEQLDRFINYMTLLRGSPPGETEGELEYPIQLDSDGEKLLLKKDEEQVKDVDNGLTHVAHNIVKGPYLSSPLHRIQGNTVYIKLDKNVENDDAHLLDVFHFLQEQIARPNNLTLSDMSANGNELSFRVTDINSSLPPTEAFLANVFANNKRSDPFPAAQLASSIYKRRKDLSDVMGDETQVSETGVGHSPDAVPVANNRGVVLGTLLTCGLVVGLLVTVLGAYVFKNRHSARGKVKQLAAELEAQSTKAYEELCRQRMAGKPDHGGPLSGVISSLASKFTSSTSKPPVASSPRSSTSSWSEEPPFSAEMDIGTGHVILSYLEDHLHNDSLVDQEWASLALYRADDSPAFISVDGVNLERNRDSAVLPYDRNRVELVGDPVSSYINASPVCDAEPTNPVYITTQGPMADTAAHLWQMIWQQGSVVIVNLTRLAENGTNKCYRYWPENGSDIHANFEIHLVSEHIWCEDYVVRSFYLKNLDTNETRTVTQFHYLSWPDHCVPQVPKPLLEFRRKVNKSYRGRSSPIVVHCSDGAGRTGTYILLDTVLNRICKGIKEINVAATVEHLRDQRMKMVETREQYEFVLTCLAQEVHAILKALPN